MSIIQFFHNYFHINMKKIRKNFGKICQNTTKIVHFAQKVSAEHINCHKWNFNEKLDGNQLMRYNEDSKELI